MHCSREVHCGPCARPTWLDATTRAAGDRDAEATALLNLSTANRTISGHQASLAAANALLREVGDRLGEAFTLSNLAFVATLRHEPGAGGHPGDQPAVH